MKDEIKEILEKIKCPQFGSAEYGSWGSLPLKVRIALKRLCEYANACDDYITTLQEENEKLKQSLESRLKYSDELDEKIEIIDSTIEYINKNIADINYMKNNYDMNQLKTFTIEITYTDLENILNILKGGDEK